jgi:predicted ester cyclase
VPAQFGVSGDVTLNGANPVATYCYSTTGVSLKFVDSADSRFNTTLAATCNTTGAPFAFTGQLYPGTYQVTASNGSPYNTDNLPNWDTVVATALTVSSTQSGVVFDIPVPPQYTVSGEVTLNGANPVATYCYSTTGVSLKFANSADSRFNTTLSATCNTTGAPFTFSGPLYPGTYQVTASNGSPYNTDNLPNWDTVVATAFTVGSAQSGVVFDIPVPPQYAVSGDVTLNGANPVASYCYSTTGVSLKFVDSSDSRLNTTLSATCNTTGAPFTFSGQLYPGTYQVTASNGSPYNTDNLPNWDTVVATALTVSGTQSGVVFDIPVPPQYTVSGDVTLNGANPIASYCYSTTGVSLKFVDSADSRFNTTLDATCNTTGAPFSFTGQLYPGTYQVTASNGSPYNTDNLPNWDTVVATALTVSGTQSGVIFDIPVPAQISVSGDVTLNGANPVATYCYSTTGVSLDFTCLSDARFSTTLSATCNTTGAPWTFAGELYPGVYQVTASNGSPYNTDNLPNWSTVVVDRLQVP